MSKSDNLLRELSAAHKAFNKCPPSKRAAAAVRLKQAWASVDEYIKAGKECRNGTVPGSDRTVASGV